MHYMNEATKDSLGVILLSFILAIILTILPLPNWANWLRPQWITLILVCWILKAPEQIGIGIAWISGLTIDVLENVAFGEHALILTIVAYFAAKFRIRINLLPFWSKALVIFSLIFLAQLMQFWLENLMGRAISNMLYWLPVLSTTLFWPWAKTMLEYWCERAKAR